MREENNRCLWQTARALVSASAAPQLRRVLVETSHLLTVDKNDIQRDRNLSRQDFMKLQKKIVELGNVKVGSEQYRSIETRIANIWCSLMKGSRFYRRNALKMHLNLSEWLCYWCDFLEAAKASEDWPKSSLSGSVDYQWHAEFVRLIFEAMDLKGDGAIDREEYNQFMKAFGVNKEQNYCIFDKIPQTNGQKIDLKQFQNLWFQYLTSDNLTELAGNYLFGDLMT